MEIRTTKCYGDEDDEMLLRLGRRNAMEMKAAKSYGNEDDEKLWSLGQRNATEIRTTKRYGDEDDEMLWRQVDEIYQYSGSKWGKPGNISENSLASASVSGVESMNIR